MDKNEVAAQFSGSAEAMEAALRVGNMHHDLGEFEEARICYTNVIESGDARYSRQARLRLAQVLEVLGEPEEAQNCHDKAMEFDNPDEGAV